MPQINTYFGTLDYDEHGAGEPTILFIHGWTSDRHAFKPQVAHFAKSHRVITTDQLGHGLSEAPEMNYTPHNQAQVMGELLDGLKIKDVVVIGHSMGGLIAAELAAMRPDQVKAVIMVDPAQFFVSEKAATNMTANLERMKAGEMAEVMGDLAKGVLFLVSDPLDTKLYAAKTSRATPEHVTTSAWDAMIKYDGADALSKITCPIINIPAHNPQNRLADLQAHAPHLEEEQTTGVGHFNQLDAANRVTEIMDGFFTRHGL